VRLQLIGLIEFGEVEPLLEISKLIPHHDRQPTIGGGRRRKKKRKEILITQNFW